MAFNITIKTICRVTMRKFLFLVLVLFSASACTVKTLYNQLDWLIADYLEDYVALSSEQQDTLYQHLDATLHWHKTSQLPLYAEWLEDFKRDVHNKLTHAKVEQNIVTFQTYIRALMLRTAEEMTVLLPTLTSVQREELYASLTRKNKEFKTTYVEISRDEQIKLYTRRMEERFELWLGSITEHQRQLIKASAPEFKAIAPEALKTRGLWQAELKTALNSRLDTATTGKIMRELFANSERLRSDNYKKMFNDNQQVLIRLIVGVANSMTEDQRQHFYSRVDEYIQYCRELAEEARLEMAEQ